MDIQKLTSFFKWCAIIHAVMLALLGFVFMGLPDFLYLLHSALLPISREGYDLVLYGFLGMYKLLFLTLGVVPYIALRIVGAQSD